MKRSVACIIIAMCSCLPAKAQTDHVGSGRALEFDGINDYVDMGDILDDLQLPGRRPGNLLHEGY